MLFFELLGCQVSVCGVIFCSEVLYDLCESLLAFLLVVVASLGNRVALVVCLAAHILAQFVVVHLMAVLALHVCAEFFRQFCLQLAHRFDGVHGSLERSNHVLLGHFFHLAFHHHDVFCGCTHHDVHVGTLHLLVCRVYYILSVYASHAHFGDGAFKRNI